MDGYIKTKKIAIRSARKIILGKYALTFLIVLLIPVWILSLVANQPPQAWTHADIVYSHISLEQVGLHRGRLEVLNTQDAKQFVIQTKLVDADMLSEYLIPGKTYRLVFSGTHTGVNHMQALYDGDTVLQDLETSKVQWEREQKESVAAIIVTMLIETIALILIDKLWCKKEHTRIQKLKDDIKRRKERIGET